MSLGNPPLSNKNGKVDPVNGKKGMVVSLDIEEYEKLSSNFGCPRIDGDNGPGELVQSFDDGKSKGDPFGCEVKLRAS